MSESLNEEKKAEKKKNKNKNKNKASPQQMQKSNGEEHFVNKNSKSEDSNSQPKK